MFKLVLALRRLSSLSRRKSGAARSHLWLQTEPLEPRLALATFTVTSDADSGEGTLREAILLANQNPGMDSIHFNLPETNRSIRPTQELPFVQDSTQIDGTTQPGYDGLPVVQLDGSLLAHANYSGLPISGSNCSVVGLHIFNFDFGILLTGGSNNHIAQNAIGADPRGHTVTGNRLLGIYVFDSSNNQIGGPNAGNLISGNREAGIRINGAGSFNNKVQGNLIGTDASGSSTYGSQDWGILISQGRLNAIGVDGDNVDDDKEANVLSGNRISGVRVDGGSFNMIAGNTIGLSADKLQPIATQDYGVELTFGTTDTLVGSNADSKSDFYERNIISANRFDGVIVWQSSRNVIQGNWIGLSGDGLSANGNGGSGVRIDGSSDSNQVGSINSENFISGNGEHGIVVLSSTGVQLSRNMIGYAINMTPMTNGLSGIDVQDSSSVAVGGIAQSQGNWIEHGTQKAITVQGDSSRVIYQNNRLRGTAPVAIDVGNDGETTNDLQDADTGPNQFQNSPTIQAVYSHNIEPMVAGSINSLALTKLTIEVLSVFEVEPGRLAFSPEKSIEVTTDQKGFASWSTVLDNSLAVGQSVVAIASQGVVGSSELSNRVQANELLRIELSASTLVEAGGSLVATIHGASGSSVAEELEINLTTNSQFSPRISLPDSVIIPVGAESVSFTVSAIDDSYFGLSSVALIASSSHGTGIIDVPLLDNDSQWHNYLLALDVNSNGTITPSDALLIINYLNSGENRVLNQTSPPFPPLYYDTVEDGRVSPSDALAVINHLNSQTGGEGELSVSELQNNDPTDKLSMTDSFFACFENEVFGAEQSRLRRSFVAR
ncbi:MAG: dockerin type I domain-containing protein [Pirellulales bacterium]